MYHKTVRIVTSILLFTIVATTVMTPSAVGSWSVNVTRLTTFPYFDAYPCITQMSDGKIWTVWAQDTYENFTLTYSTSSDLGATWSDEMNLTEILGDGDDSCPSIIQTADGTIWLVWQSNRPPPLPPPTPDFSVDASPSTLTIPQNSFDTSNITVTSLNDFSEPVDLMIFSRPENVTTSLDPTQVTPPPNGTANSTLTVTVGTTATPGSYTLTVTARAQGGLHHTVDIALEITESGSLGYEASSSDLSPEITYDFEIYYKTSLDYGATWSNATQLTTNTIADTSPSITQLTNGTILVVWQSYRTDNYDICCTTSSDGGTSWSNEMQLTTDSNSDERPSVTQMEDGRIWVAWHSNRFGDNEVFYKIHDGISWLDDERLTTSTYKDTGPSILQTVGGVIYIFWASRAPDPGATNDLYYKISSNNGDAWSERVQFTTDLHDDLWPSTTQTSDTKIWVVWISNRADQPYGNWDVYYKTSIAGDTNDDGVVDFNDLTTVTDTYGFTLGNPDWDATADINKDGIVDIRDLAIVGRNYGAT